MLCSGHLRAYSVTPEPSVLQSTLSFLSGFASSQENLRWIESLILAMVRIAY